MSDLRLEQICCPLCGSAESDRVIEAVDNLCGVPGQFTVVRCRHCRHLFMNPRPTLDCLGDCYPAHYGPHLSLPTGVPQSCAPSLPAAGPSPGAGTEPGARPWYLRYLPLRYVPGLRRLYFWLLNDLSQPVPAAVSARLPNTATEAGPQALEIGCATGRYLRRLQEDGWEVTGVEPGKRPAAIARAAGLNVHCGFLESAALPEGGFDLAAAWMVIEHVPDPRDTLTRLFRLLRPGGQLLISIPNAGCWEPAVFGRFWYVWELPRHLHHFTPASIRRLLEQCGFESVSVQHQRTILNLIGSLGMAILSRWPTSRLGTRLKYYPDHPHVAGQLLSAPLAHFLALLRQGGRLTISARRPPMVS